MATEIRLPDLGENIESGDIINVLVSEGDEIRAEQNIVEIETDKATVEVPSSHAGRVAKIHVKPGDTVQIGGLLISVDEGGGDGEADEASKPAAKKKAAEKPPAEKPKAGGKPTGRSAADDDEVDEAEVTRATDEAEEEEAAEDDAETAAPTARRGSGKKDERQSSKPAPRAAKEEEEEEDEAQEEASADQRGKKKPAIASQAEKPKARSRDDDDDADERPKPSKATNGADRSAAPARASDSEAGIAAGPAIRRLARELGVDLGRVTGSGPDGRILREDVVAMVRTSAAPAAPTPAAPAEKAPAAKAPPARMPQTPPGEKDEDAYGSIRRERMSRIRKTIASNMSRSASTIPHLTNFDDADITELDEIRRESAADYQGVSIKLTMMPFVMKAVAHALKLHPMLNASLDEEREEIVYKEYVNLGVAVDTPRGLVVPVVRDVDQMSIPQIAHAMSRVAEQARTNQFSLEELRGGTFTISNLGAVGGTYSTPIINHPEVAILLIGRSRKLPVVVGDEIKIRLMMPLSISYDHRLVDGATAARFLNEVISLLHAPGRLLLSPLAG